MMRTSKGMPVSKAAVDLNNLPYADGDFYGFEQMLSAKERERLQEIRDFLAKEVKPIATDCWNRGEFPMELIPKLAELDIMSPVHRQGYSSLFAGTEPRRIHPRRCLHRHIHGRP